jgi:hypothetical protein
LRKLDNASILLEAGLKRYAERTYDLNVPGKLSIEVLTFADPREAYSVLSFSAPAVARTGPPGDFYKTEAGSLVFAAGACFARVRYEGNEELARRVAISVTNRIGRPAPEPPPLVRHIPREGSDPASIRYFVGPQALAALGSPVAGTQLKLPPEVESAQAKLTDSAQGGTITLLSFPTVQLADQYYNSGALYEAVPKNSRLYTRETGPLVGILEGNFEPASADKILSSVKFAYSVKWIFDKNKNQARTIWGVPVRILGTVVRSLVFTAILCLGSIVLGIMIAVVRVYVRKRLGIEDDDAYIRLKMDEN